MIEKDIINQAHMFLNGTPIEYIRKLYNISSNAVVHNLTVKLKSIDPELHLNVMAHYNVLNPSKVSKEEVAKAYGNIQRKKSSNFNPAYLDMLFKTDARKYKFIASSILTFRIPLDSMSILLQIDEEELYKNLLLHNPSYSLSFRYLFQYELPSKETGPKAFLDYFNELVEASRRKDKEKISSLMEVISDKKMAELIKRREENKTLFTDEDLQTILNYILKYSTTFTQTAKLLRADRASLREKLNAYLQDDPVTLNRLNNLVSTWNIWHAKKR